jgi:Sec-independent protein secretion pathway component TatC
VSQIFLAIPMVALYLLGVGVAYIFGGGRKRTKAEVGSDLV